MTPEERDLITGLFGRLRAADAPGKDQEAEALIRRLTAEQPAAPYLLVQTVLVQDQALRSAQARIAELERQLAEARAQASPSRPATQGSFLGGLATAAGLGGPWGRRAGAEPAGPGRGAPAASPAAAPQPMPPPAGWGPPAAPGWGPPAAPPAASGGFLRSALSTAAGVAGGALLFEGIRSLIGHDPGVFGPHLGAGYAGAEPGIGEAVETTTVNTYYDTPPEDRGAPGDAPDDRWAGDEPDNSDFADAGEVEGDDPYAGEDDNLV